MESEKNFLSEYKIENYERPSVTADIVAFMVRNEAEKSYRKNSDNKLSVLLVKRGCHPFKNQWAVPGGFVKQNETIEECALREIIEETNVAPSALMPSLVFSKPDRDPRGRIISNSFISIISEEAVNAVGGDDACDADWFDISFTQDNNFFKLLLENSHTKLSALLKEKNHSFGRTYFEIIDTGMLAFDHAAIIASALSLLRIQAKDYDVIFDFLPEKFTLTALQRVQETILNVSVLPANFRRKISDYVIETNEFTVGAGHRPAKLFTRK
ncbi:MAG: NUDIX hydrolase [Ruminococcus sp.]|jgi:ADP-ribose pyrophosphatase YjhB (NUDIX family)|nr:NUDIX hydrolase [Ruminococcus sp.]